MNKNEVLNLVDSIMHRYASSYRNEAKKLVEEKFKSTNKAKVQICPKCNGAKENYNHPEGKFDKCNKCGGSGKL